MGTSLLSRHPNLRGLIIHNHGCGGMWGWETTVAQFYYREGFAVITPEFVTRDGNKLGCPGGSQEEMLKRAGERVREGIYTAVNPARLEARGEDIAEIIRWFKAYSSLPIFSQRSQRRLPHHLPLEPGRPAGRGWHLPQAEREQAV